MYYQLYHRAEVWLLFSVATLSSLLHSFSTVTSYTVRQLYDHFAEDHF